jgi:endonuclease/exonuclease/phosphatase family metal-dependent hydrolase
MLGLIPLGLTALGAALALLTLVEKLRARHDLSLAVARSTPDQRTRLRRFLDSGDVPGAVAVISEHLDKLPPREKTQAAAALNQSSESGRRIYAQTVAAAGLRA